MLSNEKIKSPITANHSFSPKLRWMHNSRTRIEFKGSCIKQDKITFTQRNIVNLFIFCEIDVSSRELNVAFTLKDCLFGAVELTTNPKSDKYSYSGYGIGFINFTRSTKKICLNPYHNGSNSFFFVNATKIC